MINCYYCGSEMVWQTDFDACEVLEREVEGIVTFLECPKCGATAEFMKLEDKEDE